MNGIKSGRVARSRCVVAEPLESRILFSWERVYPLNPPGDNFTWTGETGANQDTPVTLEIEDLPPHTHLSVTAEVYLNDPSNMGSFTIQMEIDGSSITAPPVDNRPGNLNWSGGKTIEHEDDSVIFEIDGSGFVAAGADWAIQTVTVDAFIPIVSISGNANLTEDDGPSAFTVKRSGTQAQWGEALDVLVVVGGSATKGVDYTGGPGVGTQMIVRIEAGDETASFSIDPTQDTNSEPTESVVVTVGPPPTGSIYQPAGSPNNQATKYIEDDDGGGFFMFEDYAFDDKPHKKEKIKRGDIVTLASSSRSFSSGRSISDVLDSEDEDSLLVASA